jgi:hypothetical protein
MDAARGGVVMRRGEGRKGKGDEQQSVVMRAWGRQWGVGGHQRHVVDQVDTKTASDLSVSDNRDQATGFDKVSIGRFGRDEWEELWPNHPQHGHWNTHMT